MSAERFAQIARRPPPETASTKSPRGETARSGVRRAIRDDLEQDPRERAQGGQSGYKPSRAPGIRVAQERRFGQYEELVVNDRRSKDDEETEQATSRERLKSGKRRRGDFEEPPTRPAAPAPRSTQHSGARRALRGDVAAPAGEYRSSGVRQVAGRAPASSALPPIRPAAAKPSEAVQLRVLLVDDEPALLRAHQRVLQGPGVVCDLARDGETATKLLAAHDYDVIVSDVCMPNMDGVSLLREVRRRDLDVPVILVTASPSVETAVEAVEHGALRYLYKPLDPVRFKQAVEEAARLNRLAKLKRDAMELMGLNQGAGDRGGLEVVFAEALDGLWMAYQPIVSLREQRVVAYEALCRSSSPHLSGPQGLLEAAERLNRVFELGRTIRYRAITALEHLPDDTPLFVNLHPREIFDDHLLDPSDPFAMHAERIVLEVTERRALDDLGDVAARARVLKDHGYRVAVDDLGAGYAGLSSFAHLTPSVAKLDMSLVRQIHEHPVKQRLVAGMVQLCSEMGTQVVVEGVETEAERETLLACGCDLMQGFLFARPAAKCVEPPGFERATRRARR
ncbi:MAG: EAL domain-containing protein [Myxococcales bacterium]|nr:EAL domain-containing protein [Myxococcales bacterium]